MPANIHESTDAPDAPPRLATGITLTTLRNLPDWSTAPQATGRALFDAFKADGWEYVDTDDAATAVQAGLRCIVPWRFEDRAQLANDAQRFRDAGASAMTLKPGHGLETDDEIDHVVESVIRTSDDVGLPIYIETHRASITQDVYRTLRMVERFPEVRFTGDFSHWYTGHELSFRQWDAKLDLLDAVFSRTCLMHGRIGNPTCMQVVIEQEEDGTVDESRQQNVADFREMWTRVMRRFRERAGAGDVLVFTSELLESKAGYARTFVDPRSGEKREESDRYQQAGLLAALARKWWSQRDDPDLRSQTRSGPA